MKREKKENKNRTGKRGNGNLCNADRASVWEDAEVPGTEAADGRTAV